MNADYIASYDYVGCGSIDCWRPHVSSFDLIMQEQNRKTDNLYSDLFKKFPSKSDGSDFYFIDCLRELFDQN